MLRRVMLLAPAAALALAATAGAAPWRSAVGQPIEPPYATGAEGEAQMVARVRPPGHRQVYALAAFEERDIPVYPPGTVADCFAYGEEEGLRSFQQLHWGMTCRPRNPAALSVSMAHYGRISVTRYRALRRRRARLPGVTLLAGQAGAGVERVVVRGPGRRRRIVPTDAGGGFLVAWKDWLERTTVTVRGTGADRAWALRIGRASIARPPGAPPTVTQPSVGFRPLR